MARQAKSGLTVGLISDTHGLLRPEAIRALEGVQHIIHGGDIGGPEVLAALSAIAPVAAVRGNNDKGAWAARLPLHLTLEIAGLRIHVLHDLKELRIGEAPDGPHVVVSGHSHRPAVVARDGVLFVNPGSAGPRRFSLPVAIGYLDVSAGAARGRIRELL